VAFFDQQLPFDHVGFTEEMDKLFVVARKARDLAGGRPKNARRSEEPSSRASLMMDRSSSPATSPRGRGKTEISEDRFVRFGMLSWP